MCSLERGGFPKIYQQHKLFYVDISQRLPHVSVVGKLAVELAASFSDLFVCLRFVSSRRNLQVNKTVFLLTVTHNVIDF